jgi:hypothetical protein
VVGLDDHTLQQVREALADIGAHEEVSRGIQDDRVADSRDVFLFGEGLHDGRLDCHGCSLHFLSRQV